MASMKSRWKSVVRALAALWGKVSEQQANITDSARHRTLTRCRDEVAVAAWMAAQAERTPRHAAALIVGAAGCLEVGEAKLHEAAKANTNRNPVQPA